MYRFRVTFGLLALLLAAAGAMPARAETWIVASEGYEPPYNYTERGERIGVDVEIVNAILERIGVHPLHRSMGFAEVLQALDANSVDVAFQFIASPERMAKYRMIGPFREGPTALMVRRGDNTQWSGIASLAGHRVGVVEGYRYVPDFDNAANIVKVSALNDQTSLRRLVNHRIDAIIGDVDTLTFLAARDGVMSKARVVTPILASVPVYIAMPPARADKADRFAKAFEALKKEGRIDQILAKFHARMAMEK
jgi:polar amino acid transport system substrate-binding protein